VARFVKVAEAREVLIGRSKVVELEGRRIVVFNVDGTFAEFGKRQRFTQAITYDTVPIAAAVEGIEAALEPLFRGHARDVTEENVQSRVRGTLLMAVSNKFGGMVVTSPT